MGPLRSKEDDCIIPENIKKPPCPPLTHDSCKDDYAEAKKDLQVARPPTSSVHEVCQSEYMSEKSNAARKYMVLSKTSSVEEELFGHEGWYHKRQQNRKKITEDEKEKMEKRGKKKELPEKSDVVIINTSDIEQFKNKAIIVTSQVLEEQKKKKDAELAARNAKANQRKELMLKLEAERKRKSGPMSDLEMLKKQNDAITLEEAKKALEEQEDDVKLMNSIVLYSKCVTERDDQKMDRINRENNEKDYNMKWHYIMERARHKLIKYYDDIEATNKEKRWAGAAVIRQQIAFNKQQQQIANEAKLQEGLKIQKEIKYRLEEDEKNKNAKRLVEKELMKYMVIENQKIEELKEKERLKLMIEEEKRNIYQFQKDQREQAYKDDIERIRKEREVEADRIRRTQEKAFDNQSALEDLRNQRIFEAHERAWREKEKAEIEKVRRMNEELWIAREQQKILKAKQLADQAIAAEQEFYKILKIQKEGIEIAKREDEASLKSRMKNLEYIKEQVRAKEEIRRNELKEKFVEGERLKQKQRVEKLRMEQIKEQKLNAIKKWGVPPKYCVDLIKLKVGHLS